MKISAIIEELKRIQVEEGDLNVLIQKENVDGVPTYHDAWPTAKDAFLNKNIVRVVVVH
jgi:glutaredoxin-related protein